MAKKESSSEGTVAVEMVKLSTIKPAPNNPRVIKDDKFERLMRSILDFPKMMELRPIIVDEAGTVLGGNMRLKAIKQLGYKEIPKSWIKSAGDLTESEKKQFIVKDNVGFGEWDWQALSESWEAKDLADWGVDVPAFGAEAKEVVGNFDDEGIAYKSQYGVIVVCESAADQEGVFSELMARGFKCKIVIT